MTIEREVRLIRRLALSHREGIKKDIDKLEMRARAAYLRRYLDQWQKMTEDDLHVPIRGTCEEWIRQLSARLAAADAELRGLDAEAKQSDARLAEHAAKIDAWRASSASSKSM